ncbi:uncharacterized protein LOC129719584 [Wyeomyia smithii]|uniref:uncharacterized protein LOC129719584 n=1 Tax=Wyeomyia smithii TaxID=174621 RepID=UPI002467AE32|nr:uncharacterized protein LOC129719584 [Wyeomyia smithii]
MLVKVPAGGVKTRKGCRTMKGDTKKVKRLLVRRNNIIGSAKLIKEYGANFVFERDFPQIKFRIEKLDSLWDESNEIQAEIECEHEISDELADERVEFETIYFELEGSLSNKLAAVTDVSSPLPTSPTAPPTQTFGVRLPEIKIPEFKGDFDEWMNFHDLFNTLIHSNTQLSPMQKFQYLKAVLKGDALRLVQSLAVSSANYMIAWDLLRKRFDNKHYLIKQHLSALLSSPSLKRESSSALSDLADTFEKHLSMLKKLEDPQDHWNSFLVELLSSRLDAVSQKEWENHLDDDSRPTYNDLIKFIHKRSRILQSLMLSQSSNASGKPEPKYHRINVSSHPVIANEDAKACAACHRGTHALSGCESFVKLSPKLRFNLVKRHGFCLNCLKPTHLLKDCTSAGSCRICNKHHNTMLHLNTSAALTVQVADSTTSTNTLAQTRSSSQSAAVVESSLSVDPCIVDQAHGIPRLMGRDRSSSGGQNKSISFIPSSPGPSGSAHGSSHTTSYPVMTMKKTNTTVFMLTVYVKVRDINGTYILARALLDSASERNFVTENLAQRLRLKRTVSEIDVYGIGNSIQRVTQSVTINLASRVNQFNANIEFLILPSLTRILPSVDVDVSKWEIPKDLPVADPTFHLAHGIDMIIGIQWFFSLLENDQISLGPQLPILHKTVFGYAVAGDHTQRNPTRTAVCNAAMTVDKLTAAVQRFWEVESFDGGKSFSLDEQYCENHFRKTQSKAPDGRYVVRLPIHEELLSTMGESLPIAERRFHSLERKLSASTQLHSDYHQFMSEYQALGHMEEVSPNLSLPHFYLPHHAILRPDSKTTKIRVVFDGSCRSSNRLSLNDLCYVGPTVQPTLISIILNLRLPKYVITADIEKMYRQIVVHQQDRPLQQIIWRNNPTDRLQTYQLRTVTYGTACAPFLATRVLNQLADDEADNYPLASRVLKRAFYVDDCLTGDDDKDRLSETCKQLNDLLHAGGFVLRKWSSSDPEILRHIPEALYDQQDNLEIDKSCIVKTLGLLWHPQSDYFGFKVPVLTESNPVTKRIVLSEMSRLFDPMGLVGAVIVSVKIFLQSLWLNKFQWDEQLPQAFQTWWKMFREEMQELSNLRIPRHVM